MGLISCSIGAFREYDILAKRGKVLMDTVRYGTVLGATYVIFSRRMVCFVADVCYYVGSQLCFRSERISRFFWI